MMTFTQDSSIDSMTISEGVKSTVDFTPSFSLGQTSKVNVEDLWRKVMESVKRTLERRFTDSRKRIIKPHSDRLAFACPYCGDSTKDASKKRGNLFLDSMNYHCFNGDCSAHMSLFYFLKDNGELDSYTPEEIAYIKEKTSQSNALSNFKKIQVSQDMESLLSEEALNLTVPRDFFMKKMRLYEIRGSRIEGYMRKRLQNDFKRFAFDPKKGQVYVFNLTKDETRILGFQIKTFSKRTPYLTYKTSAMHKELGIWKEENEELLAKMDTISTLFGIMKLDLNKTVTIFEGPLDSFLFPNAVGVCSAKNDFPFEVESLRYFYDNDVTGKDYAMRKLNEGFPVFLWKKYLDDNLLNVEKIKDLNDLLIIIQRHSTRKFHKFVDYFSNDRLDLYYV